MHALEDDGSVETFGILYPQNVKSSKLITYDENGDVISLSERFNSENEIDEELTAKAVSHLLTDESYIKELAKTNRNAVQRIYDAIVDLFEKIFKRYSEDATPSEAEFKDALKELQSDFNSVKAMHENALKETTNVQQSKLVLPKSADGTDGFNSKTITADDVRLIRSIGRKSLNELTEEELKKLENVAQKYYAEMGVKSPFFRRWFGDWRAKDKSNISLSIIQNNVSLPGKNIHNNDTGFDIFAGSLLKKETYTHSKGKPSETIRKLFVSNSEEILKNATLLDSFVSLPGGNKSKNTMIMHSFYSICEYNNQRYLCKIYVEEFLENNKVLKRAYEAKDLTIKPIPSSKSNVTSFSPQPARIGSVNNVSDLFSLVKTYDKDFKPKPCSLVLNKDGTPKVVYHGSYETFSKFDITKLRSWDRVPDYDMPGFYFSENADEGSSYGNIRSFYIKISNPYKGDIYALAKERGSFRDAYEYLVENEYDGFIDNEMGDGFTEYTVLNPNNIKSVENGGMFSSWDDDILLSKDYWQPDLSKPKLNTLYQRIDKDADSSVKYVTNTAKWMYTNIDGTKVFAIYSIEDIFSPTLLYECKGKQAAFERERLIDLLEELDDGKDTIGRADIISEILSGNWVQKIGSLAYSARSGGRTRGDSDVRVLPTPSKRKPRAAFISVIKNLFGIEEKTRGNELTNKEDVLKSKESTGSEVDENIDRGIRRTAEQVEASYFELKKEVQKKLDEHIKKYGAIKKGEDAVRDARFPAQTLLNFLTPF